MPPNGQQAEAWNGPESVYFVENADRYDRQLEPFTRALLGRALPDTDGVVLDVGCGSGATTLSAAAKAERADVIGTVRAELGDRYEDGVGLRLGAAAWLVSARV